MDPITVTKLVSDRTDDLRRTAEAGSARSAPCVPPRPPRPSSPATPSVGGAALAGDRP